MSGKTILVWFRNDLRIHDNEILLEAVRRAEQIVPVYCFDPRYFELSRYGTKKTGELRAKFLLESVNGLRESLKQLGGELIVKVGRPEDILPEICSQYEVAEVYHHREVASFETDISAIVEEALWKKQINLKHFIGHTLYHKEDLPFPIKNIPNDFAAFRKKTERDSVVKPCFDTPGFIRIPENMETGDLPSFSDLNLDEELLHESEQGFIGGEQEGLQRLNKFLFTEEPKVKGSRNAMSTSRLSPWLSLGCLSSREVYWAVKKHKSRQPVNDTASKLIIELQWRDFFRFMLKKHGSSILDDKETGRDLSESELKNFEKWRDGKTGTILVDACMKELVSSGYLNDKVKQYVSSFLVKELGVFWKAGAAFFEEVAIDYSPASDWGNWAYIIDSEIMSINRPLTIKSDEIAEDFGVKRWFSELTSQN
ncbi:DASH family cryptochrome [Desertivirga xinjiangensis]|uniref:DASH family cryptochrome n=1 Tax=Desertivirga xinjiangensis TaxID=539206 RepID=UPI00210E395A|nr:DASH family cryptochrome [Pedobacter xinjiangensis]